MKSIVEQIDRDEHKRVDDLARQAKAEHVRIRWSDAKVPHAESPKPGSRATRLRMSGFSVGKRILGYSSSFALGDAVRKQIVEDEEFRARQGHCRVLMRNGQWLVPPSERPEIRVPNDSSPQVTERTPDYRRNLLVAKAGSKVVRA